MPDLIEREIVAPLEQLGNAADAKVRRKHRGHAGQFLHHGAGED
jgi:hypothetical protein